MKNSIKKDLELYQKKVEKLKRISEDCEPIIKNIDLPDFWRVSLRDEDIIFILDITAKDKLTDDPLLHFKESISKIASAFDASHSKIEFSDWIGKGWEYFSTDLEPKLYDFNIHVRSFCTDKCEIEYKTETKTIAILSDGCKEVLGISSQC